MGRAVTIFTGQWADLPLEEVAKIMAGFGYDGLEVACWGDHLDVFRAAEDKAYCKKQRSILEKHNLQLFAISNHLAGQLVCDLNNDSRSDAFAPAECAGNAEKKRAWAVEAMKKTAHAARNMGVQVVNGFTGSSIWHLLYSFPPVSDAMIEEGFRYFAKMWNPILDEFDKCGVKFALEVHPTEIAFDIYTAKRALEAVGNRETFGFNFDPSHLHWQMVNPVFFLKEFSSRIYHVHMKDAALQLDGRSGILGSHLNFGDPRRGWDFRSLGHGGVNFEEIIRTLNQIGYQGPLSVEWEDSGMDRMHGAKEACEFVKKIDFTPSKIAFDAAFDRT
ncbi:MAG TPA: sugar phosphate isomerase/epimerase [Anaerohalosphaeraceae bacterium]|jgi:sugar phosphate isomerase/epimerase|nr:sugar phosphate isomerase/epimerase [Anaerohalosphaeraceae bacterium]HPB92103.1 sugar phosphate isomerase/epimerase [Anaerohalosphaeraceae bacterium]HRT22667.1 sugar phosphate isomerase/epimerase [Anaerohalosphaeraceae bacterium]HRU14428.1 sugar phosphate isomerase/epimerase [Anaerohalosphaeraceae bacterium]